MKGTRVVIAATLIAISIFLAVPGITLADEPESEPVGRLASIPSFNDPYSDQQWALEKLPTLPIAATNDQILVAVLDTGIDASHEDLAGKVVESVNFSSSKTETDVNGHGTHIAGIIAADRDNDIGVAGAASNVKLLNVKIAEDNGMVWASSLAKGIIWATDRGAKVINMSLATPAKYQPLEEAINYAWSHGVVIIAAAGNYTKAATYPAAYDNVIAVAATTTDGEVWSESNDGEFVDAYAPGVDILSTLPDNKYGFESGSSMACAYVSAISVQLYNQTADTNNDGRVNDEVAASAEELFYKPVN